MRYSFAIKGVCRLSIEHLSGCRIYSFILVEKAQSSARLLVDPFPIVN
nr:MAG TPA: hypothetical protein [Caudoviricetes sp.]